MTAAPYTSPAGVTGRVEAQGLGRRFVGCMVTIPGKDEGSRFPIPAYTGRLAEIPVSRDRTIFDDGVISYAPGVRVVLDLDDHVKKFDVLHPEELVTVLDMPPARTDPGDPLKAPEALEARSLAAQIRGASSAVAQEAALRRELTHFATTGWMYITSARQWLFVDAERNYLIDDTTAQGSAGLVPAPPAGGGDGRG